MQHPTDIGDVPISALVWKQAPATLLMSSILVLVTLLFLSQPLGLPCDNDFFSAFLRNFIHIDPLHLIINLYGFYRLTQLELAIGSIRYIALLILLAVLQTVLEWLTYHPFVREFGGLVPFGGATCSIGFSGILFGIISWMFFSERGLDLALLFAMITSITITSAQNPQISFIGHLIGLIAGLIAVPITRKIGLTLND